MSNTPTHLWSTRPNTTEVSYLVASNLGQTSVFQVINRYGPSGNNRGAEQHPLWEYHGRASTILNALSLLLPTPLPGYGSHPHRLVKEQRVTSRQARQVAYAQLRHALNPCKCRVSYQTAKASYKAGPTEVLPARCASGQCQTPATKEALRKAMLNESVYRGR